MAAMSSQFTPSRLSFSDEAQLRHALKCLRVFSRRIETALDAGHPLPPPWARATIIKTSLAVTRVAKLFPASQKKRTKKSVPVRAKQREKEKGT